MLRGTKAAYVSYMWPSRTTVATWLPFLVKYFDRSELLLAKLRQAFDNNQPPLPLTLVLDSERVIRQAFLGSIHNRRQELIDSTAHLMRLISEQQNDAVKRAELKLLSVESKGSRKAELSDLPKAGGQRDEDLALKIPAAFSNGKISGAQPGSGRPRWRIALGAVTAGAGVVLVGFGASALAAQGKCAADPMALRQTCDYSYATNAIGGSFVGVGGALTAAGIGLMAVPGK